MRTLMQQIMDSTSPVCHICFEHGHEDRDCKEDRKDFELIGPLAAMIGARLNYVLPRCNSARGGEKLVSTILVEQHKEKFWYVRVYCKLADETMVTNKWLDALHWASNTDPPLPTDDFRARCFRHDALHYRRVYLDAVKVIPRLKHRITAFADYGELLFDNPQELCDHIDMLAKGDPEQPGTDGLAYYRARWHVEDTEGLKVTLFKYYEEPSLRDHIGA
jgi:hypothetical protein